VLLGAKNRVNTHTFIHHNTLIPTITHSLLLLYFVEQL